MKKLYIDTETTGLDSIVNDIVQVALIIEIDNEVIESHNIKMAPFNRNNISQKALDIQGVSLEEVISRQEPFTAYREIKNIFNNHINKYDRDDKFVVVGQNVRFDLDFLKGFFMKNMDNYLGSYINWIPLDILYIARFFQHAGLLEVENLKLKTLCNYFKISLNAHDAMNDIVATRLVLLELLKFVKK